MMKKYWTFCVALNFGSMGLNFAVALVSAAEGDAWGALTSAGIALAGAACGTWAMHMRDKV